MGLYLLVSFLLISRSLIDYVSGILLLFLSTILLHNSPCIRIRCSRGVSLLGSFSSRSLRTPVRDMSIETFTSSWLTLAYLPIAFSASLAPLHVHI